MGAERGSDLLEIQIELGVAAKIQQSLLSDNLWRRPTVRSRRDAAGPAGKR